MAGVSEFENHCWKDLYSQSDLTLYSCYARETFVGEAPALLLVDFYNECFRGGAFPPIDLMSEYPASCGLYAHRTIAPTKRLIAAARRAGLPVFYSTGEDRPFSRRPATGPAGSVTFRRARAPAADDYEIFPALAPEQGDVVIHKTRASCFYGTPLLPQLNTLGIRSLIVGGGTASGCLRAALVNAQSAGFHVSLVEECVFDRADIPLKSNLFDLAHKYVDVMHLEEVEAHLATSALAQAAQ